MSDKPSSVLRLESDLKRRVRNLALGSKTPSNALVPVFEAVFNSLHACEARFGDTWASKCDVRVTLLDLGSSNPSVTISDNGIGLDEENFASFRTYDSGHKRDIGGKGVGRLSWLKVFDHAEVSSEFNSGDRLKRRKFELRLDNDAPIQSYSLDNDRSGQPGTVVTLHEMKSDYARHMPARVDTILRKLVSHFISYLLAETKPSITIETKEETQDLGSGLITTM